MSRRDILSAVVIFALVVAAFVLPIYAVIRVNALQLQVTCQSARANVQQLEALRGISRELGLPRVFEIPKVAAECDGR